MPAHAALLLGALGVTVTVYLLPSSVVTVCVVAAAGGAGAWAVAALAVPGLLLMLFLLLAWSLAGVFLSLLLFGEGWLGENFAICPANLHPWQAHAARTTHQDTHNGNRNF